MDKKSYLLRRLPIFLIGLLLILPSSLYSGRYAADFLELGVGARSLGMGGACVSHCFDGFAPLWNPAGIVGIERRELCGMHSSIFSGLANFDFISFSHPIPQKGELSLSYVRFAVDSIPEFPEDTTVHIPTGYFSDREHALYLTYGKELYAFNNRILTGLNLKYISQSLYNNRGTGIGFDLGCIILYRWFNLGLNFKDIGNTYIVWNTETKHRDAIPMSVKFGISKEFSVKTHHVTLAVDLERKYGFDIYYGGEYSFIDIIYLRAGAKGRDFNIGGGLKITKVAVDYVFSPYELGSSHRISCRISF